MESKIDIDLSEAQDGPTEEHAAHHDVVARSGTNAGKRIRSKIETLLLAQWISPEQAASAHRFTVDYLKGCVGRSKSCLDISFGGGGTGHPSEERHDAAARYLQAKNALDGCYSPSAIYLSPSQALLKVCAEDVAFSTLAGLLGVTDAVARGRIAQLLAVLTVHYTDVDRARGRNAMPQTADTVISLYDPDRQPRPVMDQDR